MSRRAAAIAFGLGTIAIATRTAHADPARDACVTQRHDQMMLAQATADPAERTRLLAALPDCGPAPAPAPIGATVPAPVDRGTPTLSSRRVEAELGVGALVGGAGLLLGGLAPCSGSLCSDGSTRFWLGGVLVADLAMPIAVYLVGNRGDQHGSGGLLVLGTFVGLVAGGALFRVNADVGTAGLLAMPLLGAVAGFNLARDYDDPSAPSPIGAAISIRSSSAGTRAAFGVPIVTRVDAITSIALVGGSF